MKLFQTSVLSALLLAAPLVLAPRNAAASDSHSQEVRIQTRLTGGALNGVTPSGNARFRTKAGASNFSVEVEDVNLPDGTVLHVTVGGNAAGSLTLKLRRGEIDVNTKDGDVVPQAKAGDTVVVSGADGAIVSGVLR